jgi:hypothetical protein
MPDAGPPVDPPSDSTGPGQSGASADEFSSWGHPAPAEMNSWPPPPPGTDSNPTPTDMSSWAPPSPGPPGDMSSWPPPSPGTERTPTAATGPPWPRLVAGDGYTPPRLIRWPIVVGIVLFAGWIALNVVSPTGSTSKNTVSASPYFLTANDAHFSATFPTQPQSTKTNVGGVAVVLYVSSLSDHAVGITYLPVASPSNFNLDGAISGGAAAEPHGKVVSRSSVTYQGQPAEDAVISFSGGVGQIRAVVIGSAAYIFEGLGQTASSFTHDYDVLLSSFTSTAPPATTPGGAKTPSATPSPPIDTPATTSPAASAAPPTSTTPNSHLPSYVLRAPGGYALTTLGMGSITASDFNNYWDDPVSTHYLRGYDVEYSSNSTAESIESTLFTFASPADASRFAQQDLSSDVEAASYSHKTETLNSIPGSVLLTGTQADSYGFFYVDVIATKGSTAMVIEYSNDRLPVGVPDVLRTSVAQQYAQL